MNSMLSNPKVLVPLVWGAVSALSALVKAFAPQGSIAFKVADKVSAVGLDVLKLLGMEGADQPVAQQSPPDRPNA